MIKLLPKFYYNLLLRMKTIFQIIIYFRKIYFSLFSNNLSLFDFYLNYILSLFHLSLDIQSFPHCGTKKLDSSITCCHELEYCNAG